MILFKRNRFLRLERPCLGFLLVGACAGTWACGGGSGGDGELLFVPNMMEDAASAPPEIGGAAGSGTDGTASSAPGKMDSTDAMAPSSGRTPAEMEEGGPPNTQGTPPPNAGPPTGMTGPQGGMPGAAASPGSAGNASDAPAEPSDQPMATGTYAVRITHRDTITVGLVGSSSMRTVILGVAQLEEGADEDTRSLSLSMCDYRIATDPVEKHLEDLALSLSPAALSETEFEPATLTLSEVDGEVTWETTEVRGIVGWTSSSPGDNPPASASDASVLDADADGKPGITVVFTGHESGELYLAMKFDWTFSGQRADDGRLGGRTLSRSREALLGSNQNALIVSSFDRVPDPDPTDNRVVLVRQAEGLSCADVIAAVDTLFP